MTNAEIDIFIRQTRLRNDLEWTHENVSSSSYGKMSLTDALNSRMKVLDQRDYIYTLVDLATQ